MREKWFRPETWDNIPEYWGKNNGWGMCQTGWQLAHKNHRQVICSLGGIGCNVDHAFVKVRNLANQIINS